MKKVAALFIIFGFLFVSSMPTYAKCNNVGSVIGGVVAGVAIGALATGALSGPHYRPAPPPPHHRPPHMRGCCNRGPHRGPCCTSYGYPAYVNYSWRIR